ncbi:MAG: hypothetical protein M1828_004480 [Chrysothrix sp. TS-e1954]|nr:MAG: hypothetical protein M1828_004480 [Chrysothrix sp. TS-e1954]
MPTPSDDSIVIPSTPASESTRSTHTTCPPEDIRDPIASIQNAPLDRPAHPHPNPMPTQTPEDTSQASAGAPPPAPPHSHGTVASEPSSQGRLEVARDTPSPVSIEESPNHEAERTAGAAPVTSPKPATQPPPTFQIPEALSSKPMLQHTSSLLRHGSKFIGTQQSDRQIYNVQVEIKHVDMAESFICGYLRIEGLTNEHPTLTTYFEGEIIGPKYSFHTRHAEWGSNEKVDMQHWNRFPAWRPLAKYARRPDYVQRNYADRENIFMRWKEYFLVPDHKVRTISGASFEGFYYICFNQVKGTVSGIYFHSKSEKFQQLELEHVNDYGCLGAMEFR